MLNLSNCLSSNIIARGNCINSPDQFTVYYIAGIAVLAIIAAILAKRIF